jgi:hypothetical protein
MPSEMFSSTSKGSSFFLGRIATAHCAYPIVLKNEVEDVHKAAVNIYTQIRNGRQCATGPGIYRRETRERDRDEKFQFPTTSNNHQSDALFWMMPKCPENITPL